MSDQQFLADEIKEIINKRYRMNLHYAASGPGGLRRYAIWTGYKAAGTLKQITEPASSAETREMRDNLIVTDLIDLFEKRNSE